MTDAQSAQSGSRFLVVTYPAGKDGGWLTRFLPEGHDSLFVSVFVNFPNGWRGGTKLIAMYGSRVDDHWSAFGKAGVCPSGGDFFAAMLALDTSGDPGPARFYTYYPGMSREPDGVTCWGRYGDGSTDYLPPLTLSRGVWHHVEFWVKLNSPDRSDAEQTFWLDGIQRGHWAGLSFGDTTRLRLNAIQLTFSAPDGAPETQQLLVDNLVVSTEQPLR